MGTPITTTPSPRLRHASLAAVALVLSQLAFFFWIRNDPAWQTAAGLVLWLGSALAAGALFYGARRAASRGHPTASAWMLLAVAQTGRALGHLVIALGELSLHQTRTPPPLDALFFAADALLVIGLLRLAGVAWTTIAWKRTGLDLLIAMIAAGLVTWVFFALPRAGVNPTNGLDWIVPLAYAVLDVVVVFSLVELTLVRRTPLAPRLLYPLVGGVLAQIAASVVSLVLCRPEQACMSGELSAPLWLVSYILIGVAALILATRLLPDAPQERTKAQGDEHRWTLYFPYLWVAIAYLLLVIGHQDAQPFTNSILARGTEVVIALVILRQILVLRENQRLYRAARQEVAERRRVEQEIRRLNNELEERVQQRTSLLEDTNRELGGLYQASLVVNSQKDISLLLHTVVRHSVELLGAPMGGVYLLRPNGESLELVVAHNLPAEYLTKPLALGQDLAGRVAVTGQPLMVDDYAHWEGRSKLYAHAPFRRSLGVPLKSRDRTIGVIYVGDDHQTGPFRQDQVQLVSLFADQAAIAVENAQLYTTVQQELAERKRYEFIVNTSAQLMTLINREHRYEAANTAYIRARHKARDEIIGRTVAQVWGEEAYQTNIKPHLDRCFAGEVERYQAWFQFDGAGVRYYDVTYYPYRDPDGTVARVVVVSHDITELKRTVDALRESEERFYSAFEHAAIGMALVAPDGRWLKVNRALCELIGYAKDELLCKTFQDITHPDDLAADLAKLRQLLAREITTYQMEKRYFHRQGHVVWTLLSVSPVWDSDGAPLYLISQIQDITERKHAEQELRASEQRYRELFDAAQRQARELSLLDEVRTALARELELGVVFRTVVEAVARTFGYTHVSLYLLQKDALVLQHQVGYAYVFGQILLTQGICGRVARTGQALLVQDVHSDPDFMGAMPGITSEVCVPLFDQGRVVGVLNVESTRAERLAEADLRLLQTLSAHVSIAIGQARLYDQVQRLAITDDLTGVPNRRRFFELGEAEFRRAQRLGTPLCAIMMDIDHFKQVNDQFGHAIGDQVLRVLAQRCRKQIRESDILGRYGGEEFGILLTDTDLASARNIAERLCHSIQQSPIRSAHENIRLTISLGVAVATADTTNFISLLDDADHAMYAAKRAGRNRVVVAEPGMKPVERRALSTQV